MAILTIGSFRYTLYNKNIISLRCFHESRRRAGFSAPFPCACDFVRWCSCFVSLLSYCCNYINFATRRRRYCGMNAINARQPAVKAQIPFRCTTLAYRLVHTIIHISIYFLPPARLCSVLFFPLYSRSSFASVQVDGQKIRTGERQNKKKISTFTLYLWQTKLMNEMEKWQ